MKFKLHAHQQFTFEDVIRSSEFTPAGESAFEFEPSWRVELASRRNAALRKFLDNPGYRAYGFNTGFADNRTSPTVPLDKVGVLQDNLVRSHASGWGEATTDDVVRAALFLRICSLAKGHSAVRPELIDKLIALYDSGAKPIVPKFGSLGASGDLAPLSHLGLCLMGEGEYRVEEESTSTSGTDGDASAGRTSTPPPFASAHGPSPRGRELSAPNSFPPGEGWSSASETDGVLTTTPAPPGPLSPRKGEGEFGSAWRLTYTGEELGIHLEQSGCFAAKEGLAVNNGTSFMTAWLALAAHRLENVVWHANLAVALSMEAMACSLDCLKPELHAARPHPGILKVSSEILAWLQGSNNAMFSGERDLEHPSPALQARSNGGEIYDIIQDDYSIRATPVVHGAVCTALDYAKSVLEVEINSANDNPLQVSVYGQQELVSGPHFHGSVLALPADHLRATMASLAGISDRRITKLLNDKRNYGAAKYSVADGSGIESGWMIAQYTAAALVNELKTRAMPYSVGNLTSGNESEDYVSMGGNACRATYESVEILEGVIAVELGVAARQLSLRGQEWVENCSPKTKWALAKIQRACPQAFVNQDQSLTPVIRCLERLIREGQLK